jgi:TatD DNase family protein
MDLIDTHCHIHSTDYPLDPKDVLIDARSDQVSKLICVGQDLEDSKLAIDFSQKNQNVWASIGIHPHESKHYTGNDGALAEFEALAAKDKVVAVGECGLDYFYNHSDKADQKEILEFQIKVAQDNDLPLIFHVRDAFDDFWEIFDKFDNLHGVIHCFTADTDTLEEALRRNLHIGLNGIMTFTKNSIQLNAAERVPVDKLVLETDAPYLTPVPFRGTICQPKHVRETAKFLSKLRGDTLENLAASTTRNAVKLFNLKDEDVK